MNNDKIKKDDYLLESLTIELDDAIRTIRENMNTAKCKNYSPRPSGNCILGLEEDDCKCSHYEPIEENK